VSDGIAHRVGELQRSVEGCVAVEPDRIILGEVRGEEARPLLGSFNPGHAGSMATIHANSAVKALRRFGELAMRSHQQSNRDDISAEIAETVQIAVGSPWTFTRRQ
jgi:Flp pilus assembly CpaF family ATPase